MGQHGYHTDACALQVYNALVEDFETEIGSRLASRYRFVNGMTISDLREIKFPQMSDGTPASVLKRNYQVASFFKKYRFENDVYTDKKLRNITITKELAQCQRLSVIPQRSELSFRVLQRARKIARRILGAYSVEDTAEHYRFGSKSSIGCPLADAYLDVKLTSGMAFTSSVECAKWFSDVVSKDEILGPFLEKLVEPSRPELAYDCLNLVTVPKAWDKLRPITPLTLVSLAYSYGVGWQVENALRAEGLDISTLQERHARLVKSASTHRKICTVDLQAASQSLTRWLLMCVLPREWYRALRKTFHKRMYAGDTQYHSESVLPMGNAATFPVETLVFYCLLMSISELSGVHGLISVYGDDLIYPSKMHKYVSYLFPFYGITINKDKTFVTSHFRESCGSDCFKGVDVRPAFCPSGGELPKNNFRAWLHTLYNVLTTRWDVEEIPRALNVILINLQKLGPVLRVPPSFPDFSGIKVASPMQKEDWYIQYSRISIIFADGSRWYEFRCLKPLVEDRFVLTEFPYYWESLDNSLPPVDYGKRFWDIDYSYLKREKSNLKYVQVERVRYYRNNGKIVRKTIKRLRLVVTKRGINRYGLTNVKRGSISVWL